MNLADADDDVVATVSTRVLNGTSCPKIKRLLDIFHITHKKTIYEKFTETEFFFPKNVTIFSENTNEIEIFVAFRNISSGFSCIVFYGIDL